MSKYDKADAEIQVSNITFNAWSTGQYCTATFRLQGSPVGVAQVPGTNNLIVWRRAVIEFWFDEKEGVTPVDIVFTQKSNGGQSPDADGSINFPKDERKRGVYTTTNDPYIEVLDSLKNKGRKKRPVTWEFYIVLKNQNGDEGRLHPEISNSDENQGRGKGRRSGPSTAARKKSSSKPKSPTRAAKSTRRRRR